MISHKKHKFIQLESSEGNLIKLTLDLEVVLRDSLGLRNSLVYMMDSSRHSSQEKG